MSLLGAVLDSTRSGRTPARTADALGVPVGLVEAALDHWVRLGVVTPAGELVGLCAGCTPAAGPACPTCPFAR